MPKRSTRRTRPIKQLQAIFAKVGRKLKYRNYKPLKQVRLESSNIRGAGYDPTTKVLEIEFHRKGKKKGSSLYKYSDVPESTYKRFVHASSHGKYFSKKIRGQYKYERIR
ncbi:MAG: KTSC domain-containing protein [bacterium]|nr:KTSC domain-containing protein [bacterium]